MRKKSRTVEEVWARGPSFLALPISCPASRLVVLKGLIPFIEFARTADYTIANYHSDHPDACDGPAASLSSFGTPRPAHSPDGRRHLPRPLHRRGQGDDSSHHQAAFHRAGQHWHAGHRHRCHGLLRLAAAPLVEGSFHFDGDYAAILARHPEAIDIYRPTETGHAPNHFPIGPALVWMPAVATVHAALRVLGEHSPWPADGFSPPYQLAIGVTTLALALGTLVLAYRIARRFATPIPAAIAAALVSLGTPIVSYGATQVAMSHGPACAAVALYAFLWLRTFGSTGFWRWIGLGALVGLACMMRRQLATYAALPILEALWQGIRARNWGNRLGCAVRLAAAGLASLVVFIPQFAAKQIVYGHPLGGMHEMGHNWQDPALARPRVLRPQPLLLDADRLAGPRRPSSTGLADAPGGGADAGVRRRAPNLCHRLGVQLGCFSGLVLWLPHAHRNVRALHARRGLVV